MKEMDSTSMKLTAQQALNHLPYLQEVLETVVHRDAQVSKEAREKALEAAKRLVQAFETPEDTILYHLLDVPSLNMCIRVAVDLGLFRILTERKTAPITSAELASASGADQSFLIRIMRLLTAAGYARETDDETYLSTSLTTAMNTPIMEACAKHRYDVGLPALSKAPAFFRSNGFQPSINRERTAFQDAFDTTLGFYDYIAERPALEENFQIYMKSFQLRTPQWLEIFPVEERIIKGFQNSDKDGTEDAVLLVDVGGGKGQDIKLFQQQFPHAFGRLILQDLVAQSEDSMRGIEVQKHDFFTPQSVRGARAYFFGRILSSWSDEEALQILRNTVAAMTPNYSKLIINEVVHPTAKCSLQHASLDIIMITSFAGLHRSETHWRNLLTSLGLRDIRFWYPPGLGDAVIEAVRGEEGESVDARVRQPTYHTTDADYTLPNDQIEYARLEDQAAGLAEMMHNHFIHAPLPPSPNLLIDVGCGPGTVTCQLGDTYPSAQVYGVDLSPVPPLRPKPSNVEYIVGDVRKLLLNPGDARLAFGSADFVFSRLLVVGITDWPGYVRDMASLLVPGGWLEIQDVAMEWYLHGSYCSGGWEWLQALYLAAEKRGWDLRCGRNAKSYMEQARLVDVEVKEYRLPVGTWLAAEGRPETKRIGEHAEREYGMLYHHVIPKMLQGMGFAEEKIEEFRRVSGEDLKGREGLELRFYVTIGRKAG